MTRDDAFAVTTREDLIGLLQEAAELEHGLCCSYLYAAFSLRSDPAMRVEHREAVERWREVIVGVAVEEMLHLTLVSNLLTAIGAAPHLTRPSVPQRSRYYPGGISISLRRFDDDTISRFIHLERPVDVDIEPEMVHDPDVDLDAEPPTSPPGSLAKQEEAPAPQPQALATVGDLYQTIESGFVALEQRLGPSRLFVGPPIAQATERTFRLPGLVAVTDLDSALAALAALVEQGEGVRGDWTEAHYGKFRRVRDELRSFQADDAQFDPSWPCVDNPVGADSVADDEQTVVRSDEANDLMTLFNNSYTLMTTMLLRFFAHAGDSEAAADALAQSAMELMRDVLAPIGRLLATLPAEHGSAATAGASFESYRLVTLVPHRGAAWQVLTERLAQVTEFAQRLSETATTPIPAHIGESLSRIAGTVSRFAVRP